MRKRWIALFLAVLLAFLLASPALAAETRASSYITSFAAYLSPGSASGELVVTYLVRSLASGVTKIGVSKIQIYNTDGTLYKTIFGTVSNGLLKSSGTSASGTYSITCEPNTYYYAIVALTVGNASGSDRETVTTATVKSPS